MQGSPAWIVFYDEDLTADNNSAIVCPVNESGGSMEHSQPDIKGYWLSPRPDMGVVIFGIEHMSNYEEDNAMIRDSRKYGYLFGTWYSVACVEGEMGSQHESRCVPIDKEIFEAARELRWDADAFVDMLTIRLFVMGG